MQSANGVVRRTLTLPLAPSLTKPSVFNFWEDFVSGKKLRRGGDDAAPYRVMGATIGANHGYSMTRFAGSQGKTNADTGSMYINQDGFEAVIVGVDNSFIYLTAKESNTRVPNGTYSHVSGGANTESITVAGGVAVQMYPPNSNYSIKYIVDGEQVLVGVNGFYDSSLVIEESYDIASKSDIVRWMINNNGKFPHAASGSARAKIKYSFDVDANCTINTSLEILKDGVEVRDIMFVMGASLEGSYSYLIPKSLPLTHEGESYDFSKFQSFNTSGWVNRLDLKPSMCDPNGQLCDRVIMKSDVGRFCIGYLPELDAAPSVRRDNATVKALQVSSSAGKLYMSCIDKGVFTAGKGSLFSAVCYRNVSSHEKTYYLVRSDDKTYLYIDLVEDDVALANIGANQINIIEKSSNISISIDNGSVTASRSDSNPAYAVILAS